MRNPRRPHCLAHGSLYHDSATGIVRSSEVTGSWPVSHEVVKELCRCKRRPSTCGARQTTGVVRCFGPSRAIDPTSIVMIGSAPTALICGCQQGRDGGLAVASGDVCCDSLASGDLFLFAWAFAAVLPTFKWKFFCLQFFGRCRCSAQRANFARGFAAYDYGYVCVESQMVCSRTCPWQAQRGRCKLPPILSFHHCHPWSGFLSRRSLQSVGTRGSRSRIHCGLSDKQLFLA